MVAIYIILTVVVIISLVAIVIYVTRPKPSPVVVTPTITKKVALYEAIDYKGTFIELDEGQYLMNEIKNNYTANLIGKSILIQPGYIVRITYSPPVILNNVSRGVFATAASMTSLPTEKEDIENKLTSVTNIYSITVEKLPQQ